MTARPISPRAGGGATVSDYTTISLRRDTVLALARIRETSCCKVESYDQLIRLLAGLPERPVRTVDRIQAQLPP
jgi:hypothetical protein